MNLNRPRSPQPPTPDDKNDKTPRPPRVRIPIWLQAVLALLLLLFFLMRLPGILGGTNVSPLEIPYSTFLTQVNNNNVTTVIMRGSEIDGEFGKAIIYPAPDAPEAKAFPPRSSTLFVTTLPPVPDNGLLALLGQHNVTIISQDPAPSPLLNAILNFGPLILLGAFFLYSINRARQQQGNPFGFGQSRARRYNEERPGVTFADVAGEDAAKSELSEMVDFLKEPEKYLRLGARIPRGVLLIGPPGTGKTLLARAVAGEANVPFFSISASEFVEMFVGVGASRVRDLFTRSKAVAPCIVFIDEIDAVGRQRGAGMGGGNDEREQTLNQLLVEMDGFDIHETVIVMAATNRPDVLDPALLRPGRFDRQVTVGLPDRAGRQDILKIHTRGIPLSQDVDIPKVAGSTIGFSGADLENLANEAALTAARNRHERVTMRDFEMALDRIILGSERPPLIDLEERRVVAYHEAGHALVALLTPGSDPVLKVSIVPRGRSLGVTQFMPVDERRNYPRHALQAQLLVALGGRSAEEVAIGEITTGAENDLRRVTQLAHHMVAQWGMSDEFGPINYGDNESQPFLGYSLSQGREYSEETAAAIDRQVKRIVEDAHNKTVTLLREHRPQLDRLAQELLEKEVIDQTYVQSILEIKGEPVAATNETGTIS